MLKPNRLKENLLGYKLDLLGFLVATIKIWTEL